MAGKPATPAAATAAAAAPAKRSWLGPIAGLAAGLGLAALFSSMGLGEELASFLMLALLALVAVFAIRFVLTRLRGGAAQPAMAGAAAGSAAPGWSGASQPQAPTPMARQGLDAAPAAGPSTSPLPDAGATDLSVTGQPLRPIQIGEALGTPAVMPPAGFTPAQLPAGFDLPAFERVCKMIFIRLQAANDKGDLDDLREFTTPEMFAAARLDIQEREGAEQHTDVQRVDAQLIDFTEDGTRQIASVRFQGLIAEDRGAAAENFDEIWHLVKPMDGSRNWAIAGIQQRS